MGDILCEMYTNVAVKLVLSSLGKIYSISNVHYTNSTKSSVLELL